MPAYDFCSYFSGFHISAHFNSKKWLFHYNLVYTYVHVWIYMRVWMYMWNCNKNKISHIIQLCFLFCSFLFHFLKKVVIFILKKSLHEPHICWYPRHLCFQKSRGQYSWYLCVIFPLRDLKSEMSQSYLLSLMSEGPLHNWCECITCWKFEVSIGSK